MKVLCFLVIVTCLKFIKFRMENGITAHANVLCGLAVDIAEDKVL